MVAEVIIRVNKNVHEVPELIERNVIAMNCIVIIVSFLENLVDLIFIDFLLKV
jgi:hypothetical protein